MALARRSTAVTEEDAMGLFTKEIKTMDDLFLHGLQDIYYAEQQITKALPKLIEKATNRDLIAGLKAHLEETNKQIERLDKVFLKLEKQPSGTQCPAIDGLIKETDEVAGEVDDKARAGCGTRRRRASRRALRDLPVRYTDRMGREARS
jgi:phage FluMu gp28-like protein